MTFKIVSKQSTIEWVGRKITGAHNGTIEVKDGELTINDGKLLAGRIVVDTTSINILDVTDPALNAQFAGHLASDDFFSSQKYPEAVLEITNVNGNHVEGNLTIKGITHPISFNAKVTTKNDVLNATANIIVDRTKYDMKFRSGNFFQSLGDTLIYDDFELNIAVTAQAVKNVISASL